jgi:hypothetical protein
MHKTSTSGFASGMGSTHRSSTTSRFSTVRRGTTEAIGKRPLMNLVSMIDAQEHELEVEPVVEANSTMSIFMNSRPTYTTSTRSPVQPSKLYNLRQQSHGFRSKPTFREQAQSGLRSSLEKIKSHCNELQQQCHNLGG